MTADEIADAMVATFQAIDEPLIGAAVENPPETTDVEAELGGWFVYVIPYDETEAPQDNADMCERLRIVSVAINGPIDATTNRKLAGRFVEQLRASLEESEFGRYQWDGNETIVLWDFEALKDKRQFLSLFRATYRDFN